MLNKIIKAYERWVNIQCVQTGAPCLRFIDDHIQLKVEISKKRISEPEIYKIVIEMVPEF